MNADILIWVKPKKKFDFPIEETRRFLEPGPVVLVSSAHAGETNLMTMGWHMMMADEPPMVGAYVWDRNHSHAMIKKSRECVINVPTAELAATVAEIGGCSGRDVDKFEKFGLTKVKASKVKAPLVGECHASFECRLVDASLIRKYNLFVFEVVKAHVAQTPKFPKTLHYRGHGLFMVAGATTARYRKHFDPSLL